MTNEQIPKKFRCTRCEEKVRASGSTFCSECRKAYHREWRAKKKVERDEYAKTHNDRGELINEWGMTAAETEAFIKAEEARIANDPKFDYRS